MTAQTKKTRPGGYPRRRPRRRYDYSDDTTNSDRMWMLVSAIMLAAMFAAAVCPWGAM